MLLLAGLSSPADRGSDGGRGAERRKQRFAYRRLGERVRSSLRDYIYGR